MCFKAHVCLSLPFEKKGKMLKKSLLWVGNSLTCCTYKTINFVVQCTEWAAVKYYKEI